jgi:ABC-2 type transport system permease protein
VKEFRPARTRIRLGFRQPVPRLSPDEKAAPATAESTRRSQVLSAVAGAAFFIGAQARNWLPEAQADAVRAGLNSFTASPVLAPGAPLTWPAQALLGGVTAAVLIAALSAGFFAVTVALLGRRFAVNAAAGAGRDTGVRAAKGGGAAFSQGAFRATVRKEFRLLLRDPALLSQVFLRLLYLVPLLLLMLRESEEGRGGALAPLAAAVTFMTGMLAGSLAWVTSATEEAPDLLAASPSRPGLLRRAKLTAALVPVALIVALPVAFVASQQLEAGLVLGLCCLGAGLSAGLIAVWLSKPGKRADFNKRRHGSWLLNVVQTVVDGVWAGAAYLGVAFGPTWLLPPALVAVGLTFLFRRPAPAYAY